MRKEHLKHHAYALLLSGGSGTRFWPQSRISRPKQFLPLFDGKTLFELTLKRIRPLFPPQNIFIATHQRYRALTLKFIKPYHIPSSHVICETLSRNTGPSIAASMHLIDGIDPDALVAVLPCDHLISNAVKFRRLLVRALAACDENLVIFGIPPTRPATGYGYIQIRSCTKRKDSLLQVKRFLEKPDRVTALRLCRDERFFWNSGMFVGKSTRFLQEIRSFLPECYQCLQKVRDRFDLDAFWKHCKPVSFDCGIMEKTSHVSMLLADGLGWSDVGSWLSFDEQLKKDARGNYVQGNTVTLDCLNTTVIAGKRLIAGIGLSDLIVIDTPDALLISHKKKTEDTKKIVSYLYSKKSPVI